MQFHADALPDPAVAPNVRIPYFLTEGSVMLAKLTSKNQLTLPKAIVEEVGAAEYFEVAIDSGRIVLTPVKIQRADAVREKLAQLRLTESDVSAALAWARGGAGTAGVASPARSSAGGGRRTATSRRSGRRKAT